MSTSQIPKSYPLPIDVSSFGRNNQVPDARLLSQIAATQNYATAYSRKMFYCSGPSMGFAGSVASATQAQGYFTTGFGARAVKFRYWAGQAGSGGAGAPPPDPYLTFTVTQIGGATQTVNFHCGANQGGLTDTLNNGTVGQQEFAVSENTSYSWTVTSTNGGRLISLLLHEIAHDNLDGTINYMVAPKNSLTEIYDATRQTIMLGSSEMWRVNASPLISWTPGNGTPPTFAGATWANVVDNTTAVATTSFGYLLGGGLLSSRMRQSGTNTKVVAIAYGSIAGGTGTGQVRLQGDNGVTQLTVTGITGATWTGNQYTFASTPSAFTKCDLQASVSGTGTFTLNGFALYLYDPP